MNNPHPRLTPRHRDGRNREALIALFLAASFGMMALLSIPLGQVIPGLRKVLAPSIGGQTPNGQAAAPNQPVPPSGRLELRASALTGNAVLLARVSTLSKSKPTKAPAPVSHKPPKPPVVSVAETPDPIVQQTYSVQLKGGVPPPDPMAQPSRVDPEPESQTPPAKVKDAAAISDTS